jgi:hydroxylaminobenzene mutase
MGLSSHLEGVMNGMLLMILGLAWTRLSLGERARLSVYWLALYGAFANLAATLLAAFWGAGSMMPLAARGSQGSDFQEAVLATLLVSLSLAMIAVFVMVVVGLTRTARERLSP